MHDHIGRYEELSAVLNNFWMYFPTDAGYPRWCSKFNDCWDTPFSQTFTAIDRIDCSELKLSQTPAQFFAVIDLLAARMTDLEKLYEDIRKFADARHTAPEQVRLGLYEPVHNALHPIYLAMLELGYTKMDLWK